MTHRCPACLRTWTEPGFCPHDGNRLHLHELSPPETSPSATASAGSVLALSAAGDGDVGRAVDALRRAGAGYDGLVGQTLDGRYQVLRKLGEGGMGVVFAARHAVIERPLAIKVLKREAVHDPGAAQRFVQEARAASRIGHPNIVDVTDFGSTADGMTYQVMELIEGPTLSSLLAAEGPLGSERALHIAIQVARALAAAHAKGIVHRDLKPENVFLTERDDRRDFVKIVDFGIARVQPLEGAGPDAPRLTRQGTVVGTPEYMAPEQAAGRADVDHRVDVYALGTMLYQMLVGRVPHKGRSAIQTITMQLLDQIVPPRQARPDLDLSDALEAAVVKALAKNRDQRFQTMAELLAALEALQPGAPAGVPDALGPPAATSDAYPQAAPGAAAAADDRAAPRRHKPTTRPLHEPAFVTDSPAPARLVLDEATPAPPARGARWPALVAGLAMLAVGAGGAVLVLAPPRDQIVTPAATTVPDAAARAAGGDGEPTSHDVAPDARDRAAIEPAPPPDRAAIEPALPRDRAAIGAAVPDDRAASVPAPPHDAGASSERAPDRTSEPAGAPRGAPREVTLEVLTRPGDANVFVGVNYRGPSGTRLTERAGTTLRIECKTATLEGSIEVTFDGGTSAVMCTATRRRRCVPGLKNPYDDCEEAPDALP